MSLSSHMRKSEVGEVRPSQALTTFGIGSLVDLPNLSVLVMGLDDWQAAHATEIAEERLLRSARSILGPQVARFLTPPRGPESQGRRPTGSTRPARSACRSPRSPAGWSAPSAACWPRSAPGCSSRRSPPTGPTGPATSTTAGIVPNRKSGT